MHGGNGNVDHHARCTFTIVIKALLWETCACHKDMHGRSPPGCVNGCVHNAETSQLGNIRRDPGRIGRTPPHKNQY
jgi:hypothetical protein